MTQNKFMITVEVVPPAGPDATTLLNALEPLGGLSIDGFSVATNPVAKPRMSALATCSLIQQKTGKPAILHCTTRDHNRLSLQGQIWGAVALGIDTVLASTGDCIAFEERMQTSAVRDLDVFELVRMSRDAGLHTGVALDMHPESDGLDQAVRRLERKVEAGAQFAVTQPVYDAAGAGHLAAATRPIGVPVILGILPLRTPRHAEFLHNKVAGIAVPDPIRRRMQAAADPVAEGAANAREMLNIARQQFAGACLMPPFGHYEMVSDILN